MGGIPLVFSLSLSLSRTRIPFKGKSRFTVSVRVDGEIQRADHNVWTTVVTDCWSVGGFKPDRTDWINKNMD